MCVRWIKSLTSSRAVSARIGRGRTKVWDHRATRHPDHAIRDHYRYLRTKANEILRLIKKLRRQGPHSRDARRPGIPESRQRRNGGQRAAVVSPHHRRCSPFPEFRLPAAPSPDSMKAEGTAPLVTSCSAASLRSGVNGLAHSTLRSMPFAGSLLNQEAVSILGVLDPRRRTSTA